MCIYNIIKSERKYDFHIIRGINTIQIHDTKRVERKEKHEKEERQAKENNKETHGLAGVDVVSFNVIVYVGDCCFYRVSLRKLFVTIVKCCIILSYFFFSCVRKTKEINDKLLY